MDDVEIKVVAEDEATAVLEKTQKSINSVGDAAKANEAKVKGLGDEIASVGNRASAAHPGVEKYGTGLDSVGNRADEVDTRMLGLADGISGVTDVMQGPGKVGAAGFAMGLADIGSSIFNFVIPSIKGMVEGLGPAIQRLTGAQTAMGGLGRAAGMAAGVAGVGALLMVLDQAGKAAKEAEIKDLAEQFLATGESAAISAAAIDENTFTLGDLTKTFQKLLELSPQLAEDYANQAEEAGINSEVVAGMRSQLEQSTAAQENMSAATEDAKSNIEREAEAVADFNDELDRLHDKAYSVNEAQANLTIAIAEATETVKANKEEIGAAATSLDVNTEAGARNALMVQDIIDAEVRRIEALKESGASNLEVKDAVDQGTAALEDNLVQMGFNREQVRVYLGWLRQIPSRMGTEIGVRGVEQSIGNIRRIQEEINALHGRDVGIRIVGTNVGVVLRGGARAFAHGGIVGAGDGLSFAATGGARGGWVMTGEHGPELAKLPPGTQVMSNPDTERMLSGGGGGGELTITLARTGDQLADAILDSLRVSVFRRFGGDIDAAMRYR